MRRAAVRIAGSASQAADSSTAPGVPKMILLHIPGPASGLPLRWTARDQGWRLAGQFDRCVAQPVFLYQSEQCGRIVRREADATVGDRRPDALGLIGAVDGMALGREEN